MIANAIMLICSHALRTHHNLNFMGAAVHLNPTHPTISGIKLILNLIYTMPQYLMSARPDPDRPGYQRVMWAVVYKDYGPTHMGARYEWTGREEIVPM